MKNVTQVKIREPKEQICYIPITDVDKPSIKADIRENWVRILNMVAGMLDVPSTLIMNIHSGEIEVFLKDQGKDNPYEQGEKASLKNGLYCETVLGTRNMLHVSNSLESEVWRDNPDVELNMISYLGLPIIWPDSELFGTICVLDSETRTFTKEQLQLLEAVQQIIQKDLEILDNYKRLEERLTKQELLLLEMTHRTKNSFNSILSFCQLYQLDNMDGTTALKMVESKLWNCVSLYKELCYHSSGNKLEAISFLSQLIELILNSHSQQDISAHVTGDDCKLTPETASLTGAIITELVINSIKYAYNGISPENRTISVITQYKDKKLFVSYKDHGIGIPKKMKDSTGDSLGWQILENLIENSKGHIEIVPGPGGHVEFSQLLSE